MKFFKKLDLIILLLLIFGASIIHVLKGNVDSVFSSLFISAPLAVGWQIVGIVVHFIVVKKYESFRIGLLVMNVLLLLTIYIVCYRVHVFSVLDNFSNAISVFLSALLIAAISTFAYITLTVGDIKRFNRVYQSTAAPEKEIITSN
ncbi:hypothetical protein HHL16_07100 [Pseudoflavitalea sp. G-6-1-2]|uniref:hypothetical protein n=1 Tax=Pseudoflavitalea sp. G-6-1-2 TaxID=2728841 RepID=UPI00146A1266|nr:hypothetical protein [Pseudoflavitalea sp. G-6-1-2]NML20634.1 hypothetical protein [Pseudoflavitalea sp. G-6-1-2]